MRLSISVVVPNYNGAKFIPNCINSLKKAIKECPDLNFETILVDNASTDNSVSTFKSYFNEIIINQKNLGFAKAVNQGILKSKHNFVCVLNNDLTIDKNWFKVISKTIRSEPNLAAACGTVLNKEGTHIESQGFKFSYSGSCHNINNGLRFHGLKNTKENHYPVWGSSAAIVVYNKEIIKQIGLFDSTFFAYIEDVDISLRLASAGYTTFISPSAIAYHIGGGTSSKMGNTRAKYTLINWIKLILKNYTLKQIITNFPGIMLERLRNLSYYLRSSFIMKSL